MTLSSTVLESAAQTAADAAQRAGVAVLELRTPAETERAADVLRQVWRGGEPPVPPNLLRTVQHTGGYVFGAYDASGALVATSLGLLSTHDGRPGLHSHITGVLPGGQRRGLGFAVKQHQRAWALARGIDTITWTCDPLVRRNVGFNLHALGATVRAYLPLHYGVMNDGVNTGDETDRFELAWQLDGDGAVRAGRGRLPALPVEHPYALEVLDGRPVPRSGITGPRLVQLPADIEATRVARPDVALAWRHAVREALVPALAEGLVVTGLTETGAVVLEAP